MYEYDPLDRLITVTQPWGGAGVGSAVTTYGYDVQDHLTAVTDAEGNVTTYVVLRPRPADPGGLPRLRHLHLHLQPPRRAGDRERRPRDHRHPHPRRAGQVQLATGGTRDYAYGPAGHLQQITAGANQVLFTSDDAGRLALLERPAGEAETHLLYDGRGFLTHAEAGGLNRISADGFETGDPGCWSAVVGGDPGQPSALCETPTATEPLYSSEGLLHALFHTEGASLRNRDLFYFAGRPVAQLETAGAGAGTWTYLTTDHLGTPATATDAAGALVWQGGFEPFGRDWQAGTPAGASENGVFLRFSGQWEDLTWEDSSLGASLYQTTYSWLLLGDGRLFEPSLAGPHCRWSFALIIGLLSEFATAPLSASTAPDFLGQRFRCNDITSANVCLDVLLDSCALVVARGRGIPAEPGDKLVPSAG